MDPGEAALLPLLSGWYYTWAVCVAARLELPDALAQGERTVADLATRCGADEDSLRRLLDALACLGVVEARADGRYAETPVSRFLRADVPGNRRASALLGGDPSFRAAWASLEDAVRTGQTAFEHAHGTTFFDFLDGRPDLLDFFQTTMAGSPEWNEALPAARDFSGQRVIDVGGGDGSQLLAILEACPDAEGVVLERAGVLDRLGERRIQHSRLTYEAGDFFEAVPSGGDVYLLRFVIHDWSDDDARRILGSCRDAMADGGRVLVLEHVLDADRPGPSALFDLSMLVLTGGRLRTVAEHAALLESVGLTLVETLTTRIHTTLLVAETRGSAAGT